MRRVRILILALVGALAIAACSDTPDTVDDAVSSLPSEDDVVELTTEIQTEVEELTTEIENSEAGDQLLDAWTEVRAEVTEAVSAMTTGSEVDTDAVRAELDEFQAEVEAAGEEVGPELTTAWNELRSKVEALIG